MYPFFCSKIGPRGFLAGGFLTGGFLAGGFLAGGSILSRMATQSHEKDLPEGGCANLTFVLGLRSDFATSSGRNASKCAENVSNVVLG